MRRNDIEHQEQAMLFQWVDLAKEREYPELRLLFAIPNGGHRHKATAGKLKAEGVKAGVPDLFLPVPRRGWHGLFIEMKAGKNRPTKEQQEWLDALYEQNYDTAVCYGMEEAKEVLEAYLAI